MSSEPGLAVFVLKATIVLVAALGITRVMQRASAGARHLVWLVTFGALAVVPLLTMWAPLRIAVLPAATVDRQIEWMSAVALPASPAREARPAAVVTEPALAPPAAWSGINGASVVASIWAVVALLIVASFAWSGLIVRRIVRRARELDGQAWVTPLLEIADRLGVDAPPRLLVSGDTKMPFACGVFAPTIVLPADCERWSLARRQAVLLHELAHVRRKDLLGHMLGRLVCAAYWFHPLVWMAATRLRSESERACDDLALSCGTQAPDYAEHLLDIVTAVRRDVTPTVALAMARRKEFEGRMLAILDPELRRSTPSRRQSIALIGSLALIACVVAAATPVARQASPASPASRTAPLPVAHPAVAIADAAPRVKVHTHNVHVTAPAMVHADTTGDDDRPALLAKVLRGDSSASLRRIAAWGLQEYADAPVAAEALVHAVGHDADPSVREMAAWALGSVGSDAPGVTEALGAAARTDANERVRATAVWAVGTIGASGALDAVVSALADKNPDVRERALWAIGTISPQRAPATVTALLKDSDPRVRRLAAWVLYQIHDPASLPALDAALHAESDEDNQLADIRALAEMGEASITALRTLLESPDPRIKGMAVRALAGGHAAGPWPWPWPEPRPNP
jgi:beta-lactamase regulating signal transducer with metallopeptidase domain/HEAT repeat protein